MGPRARRHCPALVEALRYTQLTPAVAKKSYGKDANWIWRLRLVLSFYVYFSDLECRNRLCLCGSTLRLSPKVNREYIGEAKRKETYLGTCSFPQPSSRPSKLHDWVAHHVDTLSGRRRVGPFFSPQDSRLVHGSNFRLADRSPNKKMTRAGYIQ